MSKTRKKGGVLGGKERKEFLYRAGDNQPRFGGENKGKENENKMKGNKKKLDEPRRKKGKKASLSKKRVTFS